MGIEQLDQVRVTGLDSIGERVRRFQDRLRSGREFGITYDLPTTPAGGAWINLQGERLLDLTSYSYLGLVGHERIQQVAQSALFEYGLGTQGARLLSGTSPIHKKLEREIAIMKGTDDALTFSTGYATNAAVISTLVGRGDVVINDRYNHASIVDGGILSGAKISRFKHNDMNDLRRSLMKNLTSKARLVVVDAVFSMDGDIAPLPEIIQLCQDFDAWLMIDEAHSFGVIGDNGSGILSHFGLTSEVPLQMGTLSKTIPGMGGYLAGQQDVIDFLRHNARPYIFSAALPPSAAATAIAAFEVIRSEPERHDQLRRNVNCFSDLLKQEGFDLVNAETPIFPIHTGDDISAWRMSSECRSRGLFIMPIVPPAVPVQLSRLRAIVTSLHTREDLELAAKVLGDSARKIGLFEGN